MPPILEESAGPIARRARHFARAVRWPVKGCLGLPRTLLVEINWRLGDEIMALPVIEALRARFPDAALDVLSNYPELFENLPAVDAVNPPEPDPDRHILLRGASRQVYRLEAYCDNAGVALPANRPRLYYVDWRAPQLAKIPRGPGGCVALAPGASWPSKRWPPDRWNQLARNLEQMGHRVLVLGQNGESLERGTDFTGQTTVREAACLLHAADLAVCCDSGLMHLALAAGTPVVALFGPTDPDFLIRDEPNFTAIRSTQSCQGFWNHAETVGEPGECPEGHACCLESIAVDPVLQAVTGRLTREAVG